MLRFTVFIKTHQSTSAKYTQTCLLCNLLHHIHDSFVVFHTYLVNPSRLPLFQFLFRQRLQASWTSKSTRNDLRRSPVINLKQIFIGYTAVWLRKKKTVITKRKIDRSSFMSVLRTAILLIRRKTVLIISVIVTEDNYPWQCECINNNLQLKYSESQNNKKI